MTAGPADLEDLADRLARVEALLSDIVAAVRAPRTDQLTVVHPTLASFVTWFGATFARDVGHPGARWCAHWAEHPEAVLRLTAVWRAYEELSAAGGAGLGTWLRDHADPQLARLTADDGPFGRCATGERIRHTLPAPLPV
jgi:hypothetical protein